MTVASIDRIPREELRGKRVLVRIEAEDDTQLRDSLPTLTLLSNSGARAIIVTHCGSPRVAPRLDYVAARLSQLLGRPVHKLDEWGGEAGLRPQWPGATYEGLPGQA
jgi:phosphoglycerate kinase